MGWVESRTESITVSVTPGVVPAKPKVGLLAGGRGDRERAVQGEGTVQREGGRGLGRSELIWPRRDGESVSNRVVATQTVNRRQKA